MEIIEFFKLDTQLMKPILYGGLAISFAKEGKIQITFGDDSFHKFVKDEIIPGVPHRLTGETMFPKDGKKYVESILLRYSGTYFWAHQHK